MSEQARREWVGASRTWLARPSEGRVGPLPAPILEPVIRWDALYYLFIAWNGYPKAPSPGPSYELAFFPLYPLAVRWLDRLVVDDVFWAAVLLSNTFALLAGLLLFRYITLVSNREAALRGTLLFLASPGAHFFSFPYTEGLFVFLVTAGLLAIERERPWLAGALGLLATATRSTGAVLTLVLGLSAWRRRADRCAATQRLLAALLSLGGVAGYALLCWSRYGDAVAFAHIQREWKREVSLAGPLRALFGFNVDPDYYLVTLGCIAVAIWMIRNSSAVQTAAGWFLLLLPLSTGTMKGMIRYQAANPTLVAAAGRLWGGNRFRWLLTGSTILMLVEAFLFGQGHAHH
jgi:hypothetical protein